MNDKKLELYESLSNRNTNRNSLINEFMSMTDLINFITMEYEIIGEGSQILTNQKRENSAFSFLIG